MRFNFQRDIVDGSRLLELPLVLVMNKQVTAKNVEEFIDYEKDNMGKVNMD